MFAIFGVDWAVQLRNCIAAVNKDSTKFFEGNNKAAGTRARKHLQELKSLAQVRLVHFTLVVAHVALSSP